METSVPVWPNASCVLIRAPALMMIADSNRFVFIIFFSPDSDLKNSFTKQPA
jgi:hypothetical protein